MTRVGALLIAAGGALGATLRWGVLGSVEPDGPFPWVVLAVNVAGSLVLGIAVGLQHGRDVHHALLRDFLGIGVCGGFTTFSTFAVDVATLARDGEQGVAVAYLAASAVGAVVAVVTGAALVGRVVDLVAPLEADP